MKQLIYSVKHHLVFGFMLVLMVTTLINAAMVLDVDFNSGADGFTYEDDAFRGTSEPGYASGAPTSSGQSGTPGIRVDVGGLDNNVIQGMSGGWQETFSVTTSGDATLQFSYELSGDMGYDPGEVIQALVAIDGNLLAGDGSDYIQEIEGGGASGWQTRQISLGNLSAGSHTITVGIYNNQKTFNSETGYVTFDDITIDAGVPVEPPVITTPPSSQTIDEGQTATFEVYVNSFERPNYRWRKNGVEIAVDGYFHNYTTPPAALSDNGAVYDVIVSNSAGSVTSAIATLTVLDNTTISESQKLSISGELYDDAGNPLGLPTAEDVDMSIALYNASVAGQLLYTETFLASTGQAVTVDDGLFVARLGEGTTSGNLQNVITSNANIWVEITVDDGTPDVLSPRTPLTASAYSLGGTSGADQLQGSGDPDVIGITAAIGKYYVNTDDNSTWVKLANGWKALD